MKKVIAGVMLATALSVSAEEGDKCVVIADVSEIVMSARQNGVPLQRALGVATDPVLRSMVLDAYEDPVYSTPRFKEQIVTEFQNQWYMFCVKGVIKPK